MKEIMDVLKARREFLDKTIKYLEEREDNYPEGTLRIRTRNNKGIYYHRIEKTNSCGQYIPRADDELTRQLAQKSYEKDYKKSAINELKSIDRFLAEAERSDCTSCYSKLNRLRKELVSPIEISDTEYREAWEKTDYEGLKYMEGDTTNYVTDAGEHVRSKSELMIANALYKYNIPYKYECPLTVGGSTIYPDFTLLNVRKRKVLYWEHFGMMGDIEYCNNAINKINKYSNSGIILGDRLLTSFETSSTPLTTNFIKQIIETYLL